METILQLVSYRLFLHRTSINFLIPTAGEDYTIESADLTVTIPAGAPMEQCIPVGIVNDEVALEGEETFQFFFDTLPEGVVAGEPNEALVTILDNDGKATFNVINSQNMLAFTMHCSF